MTGQDATANNTDSLIRIPGYRIKKVLGRGGMATVYLAIQESFGREVALKVLNPHQAQDKQFSQRFLREARIVSQLTHPNIVTVFDVGVHKGYHYLSMEYIAGRDLREACGDLSRKELLRIIKEVARALNFAAKKGYVHRDVKPENIMVHEGDGRVLLMDFGIARSYQANHGLTRDGSALGTPYYMSPEQNKGLSADHRSDIYSLGVVFFHMLSGYVPYDADSAVAIGIKHITAAIPELSDELQIFQPIINTCLAKAPEDRYQTAAELIEALDKITDEDLAIIEEKSAAFREAGKDHHAETLISSGINSGADSDPASDLSFSASKEIHGPAQRTTSAGRRSFSVFILFLLMLVAGALAYQQRQAILTYAQAQNIAWLTPLIEKLRTQFGLNTNNTTAINHPAAPAKSPAAILPTADKLTPPAADVGKTDLALETQKLDYIDKVQSAINAKQPARALSIMAEMQQQFPDIADEEKFIQTQKKLQQTQTLNQHIDRAKEYFAANAFVVPEKANALSELEAVLTAQADNREALALLEKITLTLLEQAKRKSATWQFRKELQKLDATITRLNLSQAYLLKQQKKLQQAIRHIAQVKKHLQQAEAAFKKGQLIIPVDSSAYTLYQNVLSLEAHNRQAKQRLKQIEVQIMARIAQAIEQNQLTQASVFLEQAQSIYGRSEAVLDMQARYEKALAATLPKISHILFSARALNSLDQPQAETLPPGRTVYIGFHYENMGDTRTLLQAVLLDGAGRIQIAQKPVIVAGKQGEHFFQIDLPVEGFSEGSYILEVRLENKRLLSQEFLVKTEH